MQTVVGMRDAVRAGRLTAAQAVEGSLARIERGDRDVGAFERVRADAARAEAAAVDARADRASLPLAGVPIAVKDNVPVAGEPCRAGSAATSSVPSREDHEVVRRLRAAGAVVVGLTRVPELCVFGSSDGAWGTARNPWDPSRTPGGSSGGSAAAVAAGFVAAAHGNDGMGSVRIPAACCGLVGVKPGRGTVPADLGSNDWFGMAENGVLATTAADAALLLSVMAGDPSLAEPEEPLALRFAVAKRHPVQGLPVDQQWQAAAQRTAAALRAAGHSVEERDRGYPTRAALAAAARWTAGTAADAAAVSQPGLLEPRVRRHAAVGRVVGRLGLVRERDRAAWVGAAHRWLDGVDLLLTPALAAPPKPAVRWSRRGWLANVVADARYAPYAAPWNLAGWPAAVVPAGVHSTGTPLAVQLVARPGGERLLLEAAALLERVQPWERLAPRYRDGA